MTTRPGAPVVVRHGESTLNGAQRFTGRMDVDPSEGEGAQAHAAGALMRDYDVVPDVLITSPRHPRVCIASDGRAPTHGGRYLDPTSAHRPADQVAGEGGT